MGDSWGGELSLGQEREKLVCLRQDPFCFVALDSRTTVNSKKGHLWSPLLNLSSVQEACRWAWAEEKNAHLLG